MRITLLSKPGFSGSMLAKKIEEAANSRYIDLEINLNQKMDEADVVLLTPQREGDLQGIQNVVKVPVGLISLRDFGLLNGDGILKYAIQLVDNNKNRG